MANFEYIALDAKGEETTGSISASNEADAIAQLRKGGLYPTQVAPAGKGGVSGTAKRRAKKGAKAKGKARATRTAYSLTNTQSTTALSCGPTSTLRSWRTRSKTRL